MAARRDFVAKERRRAAIAKGGSAGYRLTMKVAPNPKTRRFEATRIVAFVTFAAMTYGILHDQVTAHLCVEYFTVAHPPVFATSSPFLLAVGWGIIATWWVGLSLGIGLALAARAGRAPRLTLADLRGGVISLMLISGVVALLAGLLGATLVAAGVAPVPGGWSAFIPPDKHVWFSADAWAHEASYISGAIGGLFLIGRTVWSRQKMAASQHSISIADGL